jgi:hypothetical protein
VLLASASGSCSVILNNDNSGSYSVIFYNDTNYNNNGRHCGLLFFIRLCALHLQEYQVRVGEEREREREGLLETLHLQHNKCK